MFSRRQSDPECFETLIAHLRAEGHDAFADQLADMIHHTAWTTGSELNGELALASAPGHFGLASLDELDLRQSRLIVVFPHRCESVALTGLPQLREAACVIGQPAELGNRKAQPWDGKPLRFTAPGQVAVLAAPTTCGGLSGA
jgi:hypothetical protein